MTDQADYFLSIFNSVTGDNLWENQDQAYVDWKDWAKGCGMTTKTNNIRKLWTLGVQLIALAGSGRAAEIVPFVEARM